MYLVSAHCANYVWCAERGDVNFARFGRGFPCPHFEPLLPLGQVERLGPLRLAQHDFRVEENYLANHSQLSYD